MSNVDGQIAGSAKLWGNEETWMSPFVCRTECFIGKWGLVKIFNSALHQRLGKGEWVQMWRPFNEWQLSDLTWAICWLQERWYLLSPCKDVKSWCWKCRLNWNDQFGLSLLCTLCNTKQSGQYEERSRDFLWISVCLPPTPLSFLQSGSRYFQLLPLCASLQGSPNFGFHKHIPLKSENYCRTRRGHGYQCQWSSR